MTVHASTPLHVAIVVSHPTQYYAPWFRHIASTGELALKVYYLWDFGVQDRFDPDFGRSLAWDIPLLDGYDWEFVPNVSADPGTTRFGGLDNPDLNNRLAAEQPDAIILFGYAYKTHMRLLLSSRLRHIPILLRGDSHDIARATRLRQRAAQLLRRMLFRRLAGALAVGSANRSYFLAAGMPADNIHMVPHCVDNARFSAAATRADIDASALRAEWGVPQDAVLVMFAGKFEDKKRPLDLLEAFCALEQEPAVVAAKPVLVLVGDGAHASRLRARAGGRLGKSVFIVPFQNQSRMPTVYAAADLLVLPSYGNGETWGLVINEAMNLGVPCLVSSHVGGGQDLVRPGETGWCFPAGDERALVDTLREAITCGPGQRRGLGDAARRNVQAHFSFEVASAALVGAVESAAGRARCEGVVA